MLNPRLAARYAKSLLVLAQEQGNLDEVQSNMGYLSRLCKESTEFTSFLRSPVIQADKKVKVVSTLIEQKINKLSFSFVQLLITKGREALMPEIAEAFLDLYRQHKGIQKVKITTAQVIADDVKMQIVEKVKTAMSATQVELETKIDESIIGGFQLEYNGQLLDASIARDLRDVRQQFEKNVYIKNL